MDIIRAPAGPHQGPWFSVGLINSHIIENYQGRDYADEGIELHTVGRKASIIMRDFRGGFPSLRDVYRQGMGERWLGEIKGWFQRA